MGLGRPRPITAPPVLFRASTFTLLTALVSLLTLALALLGNSRIFGNLVALAADGEPTPPPEGGYSPTAPDSGAERSGDVLTDGFELSLLPMPVTRREAPHRVHTPH